MKKQKSLMEDKRNNEVQRPLTLIGTQKAHPIGKPFAALFGSRLVTVVSEAVS